MPGKREKRRAQALCLSRKFRGKREHTSKWGGGIECYPNVLCVSCFGEKKKKKKEKDRICCFVASALLGKEKKKKIRKGPDL